jgi:hypothetical protein
MEYAALGFSPRTHPLEFFTLPLRDEASGSTGRRHRPASVGPRRARGWTTAVGLLAAMRHYKANGADIYFLTLDNPRGLRECVLPTNLLRHRLEIGKGYRVAGLTAARFGVQTLRVRHIEALAEKVI